MTKAEWHLVETALSGVWGVVELEIDGFKIRLQRCLISKNRLGTMTYVNGKFEGKWFSDKTSREGDFLRPTKTHVYSTKTRNDIKRLKKRWGKRQGEGMDEDAVYRGRSPFWGSAAAIRRHYEKTFTSIKLLKINGLNQ